MSIEICGVISNSGRNFEPIACGFAREHEGDHSWSTLPSFGPGDPGEQLALVNDLVRQHQAKQNYHRGFGNTAELVKSIMREYEDKAIRALSDTKQFRDDMLSYFRALVIVLEMVGHGATHAEKNARLRGSIEVLESAIEKLRRRDLDSLFAMYQWSDAFRSDWPTRRLMDRIHELEREAEAKVPQSELQAATSDPPF